MIYTIEDVAAIPTVAKQFLEDHPQGKVFAFDAEMGVGKTTFITGLLKAMGINELEGSPTYSLVNVYDSVMFGKIYHFDVYRLKNQLEAFDIGIEEMFYSGGICFVEWPEKVIDLLPENTIWVYLRRNEDNSRTITVKE
ncbi:MAG: tRNA (adenosine(37)-N6)-threonylcarbamoyltransferase complex ATPase subunit type 1 TsaE [Crocinitomicaceae bacterium]|nr:tRNA (adenosine(37)-N6)-threonylcarbamoyltransferase complex ATPase subunit type 1 TsaE [Crocinitomicaceae bacterium]